MSQNKAKTYEELEKERDALAADLWRQRNITGGFRALAFPQNDWTDLDWESFRALREEADSQPDPSAILAAHDTTIRQEARQRIEEQIEKLAQLEPGWDNGGAPSINPKALHVARELLTTPGQATPTHRGGVQIDWHCGGVDVELVINPDGTMHDVWDEARRAALVEAAEILSEHEHHEDAGDACILQALERIRKMAEVESNG